MLKKTTFSPSQPWRAKTRLVPSKAASESKLEAYPLGYVEDFDEPRTTRGKERVSARRGWAGEESGFFSILLLLPP
jgi:hypothetical protein